MTIWLTADTLKCSAVAGNRFETFMVSEILKSYINEERTIGLISFITGARIKPLPAKMR